MKTFIHTHTHTRQLRSSSGQVVQCPTHVQHVRPQKLCRSRDSCVEQSAIESTWRKTQFSELQAPAENSLVYCWPLRNVNNYLLRYRNTLTYLLTYLHKSKENKIIITTKSTVTRMAKYRLQSEPCQVACNWANRIIIASENGGGPEAARVERLFDVFYV